MSDLMKIVLVLSASGTVLAAALAVLRRLLKDKLPKALFYYLWLLVLLRLVVPVALPVPGLELTLSQPQPTPVETVVPTPPVVDSTPPDTDRTLVPFDPSYVQIVPADTVITGNGLELSFQQEQTPWYEQVWDFLCAHFVPIWLGGAALHFLWFAFSYFRFSRSLKRDSTPLWEHEQAFLNDLRGELRVEACRSPLAGTPMLVGLVRHRIILPDAEISTRELEYILHHELTHLRRRDLLFKWFAVLVTSFHWFNPLMPWLRREISRCCELSCDEAVIGKLNDDQKQQYGETLLALAALHALPRAVPATTLCEEKQQLKERLLGIVKYKKATALILLLSCLLALLIAGCAAVLGPQKQKDIFTGPLTEEQQAPVLENIHLWAEENIEVDGEVTVTYSEPNDHPQSLGWLTQVSQECHLYDLHTGKIKAVDGTYPDTAHLGMVLVQGQVNGYNRMWVFYLTNGDPAKAADPIKGLEQLATDYPGAKVGELNWFKMEGKGMYITVDFQAESLCYQWEYSSVSGQWGETPYDEGKGSPGVVPLEKIPGLMTAVIQWQAEHAVETDRENYTLNLSTTILTQMDQSGSARSFLSSNWTNIVVYDLATGEITNQGREYTGTTQYGCLVLLGPAKNCQQWVYVIDESGEPISEEPAVDLTGRVAVLTQNAPLDNAFAQTVDTEGRTIVMDMAMALKKGDLVYVDSQEGETCNVTLLAGEPPRVQGQLSVDLLTIDPEALQNANQVILKDAPQWVGPHENFFAGVAVSGVANVEERRDDWLCVTLPGGDNAFWVRRADLTWEWPLITVHSPENLSAAELKSYYIDFAMDWRVDFIPDFDWNSFSGTVSAQDFLMLTYYQNRDRLPEDNSMTAEMVEQVMETQFGIESVQHESLFKTWNWDAKKEVYLPVPQGTAEDGLFDTVAFNAAERWVEGSEQTVYTVTLREYGFPFVYGTESYDDLVNDIADESAYYRANVQFLLENKGDVLKNDGISAFEAMRQLILEGNTSGFTKGIEIRLEYYMTGNGPRFLYKSEREFDFTPGEIYQNDEFGYRLTLPACWGDDYRLIEEGDSLRIEDAWGGTLCSIFVRDTADFAEERIPVPYRVLGQNSKYVYLMYFASDVQYDPSNKEQTAAYLNMYQDLQSVPFEVLEDPAADLAGKTFVYEKEGFGSDFTMKLYADGTFEYYEGLLSSHIGLGTWELNGDVLVLHEDAFGWNHRFRVQDGGLSFLREGSDQFLYIKLADGARFLEDIQAAATIKAYGRLLWNAYLKGELPDGSKLDWTSTEGAAENHFAITDIDGDGRQELLISWTNSSMAGHDFPIFDYRDGELHRQDLPFTSLRFYDNGTVAVDRSHNQGASGDFWPYDVYDYEAESDTYQRWGTVEAWNKSIRRGGFPDDIDADRDGVVYYLHPADRKGQYSKAELVDGDEYLKWRESWLGDAKEVTVTFQKLTEENIAALGAPKPNVVMPEPVG